MSENKERELKELSEWLAAPHFHPHNDTEILNLVISAVRKSLSNKKKAAVVFDIDSTLYDVGPRHCEIIRHWAQKAERGGTSSSASPLVRLAQEIVQGQIKYSLEDTFSAVDPEVVHSPDFSNLRSFWYQTFFSDEYLDHDLMYTGALEFVNTLLDEGAHIVLLTGRNEENMGQGTRAKLQADGFKMDHPRLSLQMKPTKRIDDLVYKKAVFESLLLESHVLALFENEPKNLVALSEMARKKEPDFLPVFVETFSSDSPAPSLSGIYRLLRFSAEA